MFPKSWLLWPDATIGQAVRNRAMIRVTCRACGEGGQQIPHELVRLGFALDRRVGSLKGVCRSCGARAATFVAAFPEGWIEADKDWQRRREEGL